MSASATPTTTRLCASWATVEAKAPRIQPEPAHEPEPHAPGAVVALDHRDLRQVARRVRDHVPVDHQRRLVQRVGDQLAGLDADHPHALGRARDAEGDRDGAHRVAQRGRRRVRVGRLAPVLEHQRRAEVDRGRRAAPDRRRSRARSPRDRTACAPARRAARPSPARPPPPRPRPPRSGTSGRCAPRGRGSPARGRRCRTRSSPARARAPSPAARAGCARWRPRGSAPTSRAGASPAPPRP